MRRRVALTGGIASGKSTVGRLLAGHGALLIDYDLLSHDVVERGTEGLQQVARAFGSEVLSDDGGLDRAALAGLVFADPAGRERLEGIIHPLVLAEADRRESAAPGTQIVVHDVPLLIEADLVGGFDVVLVTDIDPEEQVRRAVARDGMSESQARARLAAQATREQRLAVADIVIDTSGPLSVLDGIVDEVWERLVQVAR
ncbi:Dephospho-CoA kinase [Acidipropionibacterium acidipropionici ATCC 4875]|uniref:Dephospho-CoA kinase n=1 Tax=Acidipropionibacterium acidipropionici (strain ATCC 4875 / DSM 20272 / JCM 6432 / NBRC 12425 / NCIMB 8070 / 4) TaxID=1171373 RepID=K7RRY0_ACIA4|nr:Dephospho-CoA kinase [Acidipropionibacterium acidipropionici ATCC 4875]